MILSLKLRFHTHPGQSLFVTGEHPLFGHGDPQRAVPLHYVDREHWQVNLQVPDHAEIREPGVSYSYILRQPDGTVVTDWGRDRFLTSELLCCGDVLIVDSWNVAGFAENAFDTEPFREVLLRENQTPTAMTGRPVLSHRPVLSNGRSELQTPGIANEVAADPQVCPAVSGTVTHAFRVKAPLLGPGQTLCLLGSTEELGLWNPARAVILERTNGSHSLTVKLNLSSARFPIEYKCGVYDFVRSQFLHYEGGNNRWLHDGASLHRLIVVNDGFAVLPVDWKGAGVAIPVFSLRSSPSFGVGEFTDLKPLVAWCKLAGLKLIQVLPVNDTTATNSWLDSYPYAAISAFALHPVYLNLSRVATGKNRALLKELEPERTRLNALPEVDYELVMRAKLGFLKRIYLLQSAATFHSPAYRKFFAENRHWLEPYAVFCFLRDRYGTADSSQWPEHRRCTAAEITAMMAPGSPDADAIGLYCFVQFHLHTQLQEAAAYAHANGIILKGDIAIGVSRHGADTWQHPELFHLDLQAGAPPDPFAEKGQNWGFPTYNWPRMMEDGFGWWKQRFAQMGRYFDAFRIDHILGFFRIWSIPTDAVEGILGRFYPAIPVERSEFIARGIEFDPARFLEPFINEDTLRELFGVEAERAKRLFLSSSGPNQFELKPEFSTQRQVERYFAQLELTDEIHRFKKGLFDLISNVILFEVEGSNLEQFHFRFHVEKTASYRALDPGTRTRVLDLYTDYFFRRQDEFWRQQAMQKLPALKRVTDMLICGEDLGLVPACVPGVMKELGLLSLEIQRMPKVPGVLFSRPSDAPYLSVVTPSTHDMSTIRGWWEEDQTLTQRFYSDELQLSGAAPATCSGEINAAVIDQHLASPAMWSIFQLQDLLGMDEDLWRKDADAERINVPANPRHYWRYRMHLTLESLLKAGEFTARLKEMIRRRGR